MRPLGLGRTTFIYLVVLDVTFQLLILLNYVFIYWNILFIKLEASETFHCLSFGRNSKYYGHLPSMLTTTSHVLWQVLVLLNQVDCAKEYEEYLNPDMPILNICQHALKTIVGDKSSSCLTGLCQKQWGQLHGISISSSPKPCVGMPLYRISTDQRHISGVW